MSSKRKNDPRRIPRGHRQDGVADRRAPPPPGHQPPPVTALRERGEPRFGANSQAAATAPRLRGGISDLVGDHVSSGVILRVFAEMHHLRKLPRRIAPVITVAI